MRLVEVTLENVTDEVCRYRKYKWWHVVEEFMESSMYMAQLKDVGDNAYNVRCSLNRAINKMHAPCVAMVRRGKVFLVKKEALDHEISRN